MMHPVVYVYSDESGVFDKFHKDYFVYAGIAVIGQDNASILTRSYLNAEKNGYSLFVVGNLIP